MGYADDIGYAKAAGVGCVFDMTMALQELAELSGYETESM